MFAVNSLGGYKQMVINELQFIMLPMCLKDLGGDQLLFQVALLTVFVETKLLSILVSQTVERAYRETTV